MVIINKYCVWRGVNKAYAGGILMFRGCVNYSATGHLVKIDGNAACMLSETV